MSDKNKIKSLKQFIGGKWVDGETNTVFDVINPINDITIITMMSCWGWTGWK